MSLKKAKKVISVALAIALIGSCIPVPGKEAKAASSLETAVNEKLVITESDIKKQLTENLKLPTSVPGLSGIAITYSVLDANPEYVSVEGNMLKVNRPYAGEGNYSFTLRASVSQGDETCTKEFPMIIREGLSDDSDAGYLYTCFAAKKVGNSAPDVQQVHFFLSEDGMNWTAVNGCNPAFLAGNDYSGSDYLEKYSDSSMNYRVKNKEKVSETVSGDASVLFPFEGNDQGIRDPYLLRGAKKDGSDAEKIWLLATDLNTMNEKYGGNANMTTNGVGDWGNMSSKGSTYLFVYETEDFVNWTRRWIDVGSEVSAGAAWAPEAIYNPEKDNYLVYWSCRVNTDGLARNRIYCNETEDFVTFGPTKIYEQEAFYKNYGKHMDYNDGYGNIDTSQIWVADEEGNPYGTVYRVVKDETNNHIELMSSQTLLDPEVDYMNTNPNKITPYAKDETTYSALADINALNKEQSLLKAEIVYNWFLPETTGNHFNYISQKNMEAKIGAYEGATMFKFFDRDEWCVMIDFYGSSDIRYEPYVTTDLSKPDSITKVASGYGRTGGDVGCHGSMIAITTKEYNTLIDTYNADSTVSNYHPIEYISVDKRELEDRIVLMEKLVKDTSKYTASQITLMQRWIRDAKAAYEEPAYSSEKMEALIKKSDVYLASVTLDKEKVTVKVGESVKLTATVEPNTDTLAWTSSNSSVATVANGMITGVSTGSAIITVTSSSRKSARIQVSVVANDKQDKVAETELQKIKAVSAKKAIKKRGTTKITMSYPAAVSAKNPKVSYKASGAVSVSSAGKITGKKTGTGKVTATVTLSTGQKVTRTVSVKVGDISGKSSVKAGKTITLKVKGISGKVTWKVNKSKLASISKKGKLKAKKKGKVVVTGKVSGVTMKKTIQIKK